MQPNNVNAILVWRTKDNIDYLDISEAGEKLRAEVLSWAVMYCLKNNHNLQYMIDGGVNRIGSQEFLSLNW
jgi:CO dehydrogenase/acetyl-CoA synthase delta subunit